MSLNPDLSEEFRNDLKQMLESFCIPVTFYARRPGEKPLSKEEIAQLFHDFNFRIVPVRARLAIALDTSDIYIRLSDKLGAECANRQRR